MFSIKDYKKQGQYWSWLRSKPWPVITSWNHDILIFGPLYIISLGNYCFGCLLSYINSMRPGTALIPSNLASIFLKLSMLDRGMLENINDYWLERPANKHYNVMNQYEKLINNFHAWVLQQIDNIVNTQTKIHRSSCINLQT